MKCLKNSTQSALKSFGLRVLVRSKGKSSSLECPQNYKGIVSNHRSTDQTCDHSASFFKLNHFFSFGFSVLSGSGGVLGGFGLRPSFRAFEFRDQVSLPPSPLRLLTAGAKVAGWELLPLKIDTLTRRTLTPISFITGVWQ